MQRDNRTTYNQPNRSSVQTNRAVSGQSRTTSPQASSTKSVNAVICRKCKSQQVVANKRGYSFANLFTTLSIMILFGILTIVSNYFINLYRVSYALESFMILFMGLGAISLFLALPVSILVGFVGRSEIVNGCMNCGFKWRPAKRK